MGGFPACALTNVLQTNIDAGDVGSTTRKRDAPDFAKLNVPMSPSTTDVVARTLLLQFANMPFTSTDNNIFSNFLLETTQGSSKMMALSGTADSTTLHRI